MAGFAFVNNADLIVNDKFKQASWFQAKMQQPLTLWHEYLSNNWRPFPRQMFLVLTQLSMGQGQMEI